MRKRTELEKEIMDIYPHLFVGEYGNYICLWVAIKYRELTRDGTAIENDITVQGWIDQDPKVLEKLAYYNEQAKQSKENGWFFCTAHKKAEPRENYGYFHFAGSYCKQYAEQHPEKLRAALEETYD